MLSITEVNKYFASDDARKCVPTAYAEAQGAYTSSSYTVNGEATCRWWLRSPGNYQYYAASVLYFGGVYLSGDRVNYASACVRPALWVTIS